MWAPTIELDALQKLEILEKEWLPIVIEKSYQQAMQKSEAEKNIEMLGTIGILPIWRTQIDTIEKIVDQVSTFEEYINKRPLIKRYNEIRKKIWNPSETYLRSEIRIF